MNTTLNPKRQKAIDRWMEEVRASRESLDKVRQMTLNGGDDSHALDKAWDRYFRAVTAKGRNFKKLP